MTQIATKNPCANGMAERMVATVKAAIHRRMVACPELRWWEALPDVARAVRVLPAKGTGLSPFVLQHKQHPKLGLSE